MVNNPLPIRWEYPPRYSQLSSNLISSPLENNINLEIILVIFICFLILWKMRNNPWIKYFVERFLMIQLVKISTEIRILWIVLPIFIMNSLIFNNSLYSISILIPFSFYEINFRDSFDWKLNSFRNKPKISYHNLQTLTKDIEVLLLSLSNDVNYSMSLSFISSYKEWKQNKEKIDPLFINDAIIVNNESDPLLITQFIMQSLNDKGLFITNCLFDPVILTVTVAIIVEI
jgi:hypothetical protein